MCYSLLELTLGSRNLSQADKEITDGVPISSNQPSISNLVSLMQGRKRLSDVIRFVSMTSLCLTAAPDCRTSQSKGRYCMRGFDPHHCCWFDTRGFCIRGTKQYEIRL